MVRTTAPIGTGAGTGLICRPSEKRGETHSRDEGKSPSRLTSPYGEVTLYWKLASTTGANIRSLRAHAVAVQATTGDTLVLALRLHDSSLEVTRLGSSDAGIPRLQKLLGRTVRGPVAARAAILDCRREDVSAVLRARGDHDLVDMLDIT